MPQPHVQPTPDEMPTRIRILEAARRLFHEQGFHATGISTILREADVNSGSLYHHFKSKDDLLIGVLSHYIDLLRPVVMDTQEQSEADPLERVFTLLGWYRAGVLMCEYKMGCPIGNLALEVADDHPAARELIHINFTNWKNSVRSWLEQAGDRLPTSTDLDQLATLVLTVMEGAIMQARAAKNYGPYDASVAQLRAYVNLLIKQAQMEKESKR
jgi:TetR/AcrR family transcriptional repressor of nem operon